MTAPSEFTLSDRGDGARQEAGAVVAFLNLFLDDQARGTQRTLADYQARFPEFADAIAREHAALAGSDAKAAADSVGDRFRPLGEVARGGMGRIVRVWDRDLSRELAMKVLRDAGQGSRGRAAMARFLAEAKVTGQLQHPGIVPVHHVGSTDDGFPFFTMALVRGSNFEKVIADVRSAADGWTLARALDVLIRVCDAVAFAHSRGVAHRDLKPSNVMVGQFGETYVMDWGLAKVGPGAEAAPSDGGGAARPSGPALLTAAGDVLGTPPYMAPEQARGDTARVGPAADIYALGAILYHLLTGRMPFGEEGADTSSAGVLARVVVGPPVPVTQLDRSAPQELVAICEKAMARALEERYPSVAALGDDLRAFRDMRVVAAYEAGALAELRKWVRRNRLAAAAAAAAVLALLVGLVASLALKRRADWQAARAEAGYGTAVDAVDRLLVRVSESSLKDVPGAEKARRETLQDAREFYQAFLEEHGHRREVRRRAAGVNAALGKTHYELGEFDDAEARHRQAIALYDVLVAEAPDDPDLAYRRCWSWYQLSQILSLRKRLDEAEAALRGVLETVEAASARHPANTDFPWLAAAVENDLGHLFFLRGRGDEAIAHAERSVELAEALLQRAEEARTRRSLTRFRLNLGFMLIRHRRAPEAKAPLLQAIESYDAMLESDPRDPGLRGELASALQDLEHAHNSVGESEEAKAANRRSLELLLELVAEFPRISDNRSVLAGALNNRAIMRQNAGELEEALADLDEAIRHQRIALAAVPDHAHFRERLGNHLRTRLWGLKLMGRHRDIAAGADDLLDLGREDPRHWRDAGSMLLIAAGLALADASMTPDERQRICDELVARGAERVRTAMGKGLQKASWFDAPEYAAVRQHPGVLELLREIEAAAAAAAGPAQADGKTPAGR
jgi:tetratricopeptide (TPR) repeat protein